MKSGRILRFADWVTDIGYNVHASTSEQPQLIASSSSLLDAGGHRRRHREPAVT
jgi:hypothetical protein